MRPLVFSRYVGWLFLLTGQVIQVIVASNITDESTSTTSDAPSATPISLEINAAAVNCTMETIGNVSLVNCINYCGADTWFSYQVSTTDEAFIGEMMWESPVNDFSCQIDCGGNTSVLEESMCNSNLTSSNLTSAAFSSRDVCQQYCDIDVPLWSDCLETTNTTTTCHLNLPSPLVYTLSNATLLTIANESSLFLECPTGQDPSSENCTCALTIGSAEEECRDCVIASLNNDAIQYGFDCSNHFKEACAIVNTDGECVYNETDSIVVFQNASDIAADSATCVIVTLDGFEYFLCADYCGPGSTLQTLYRESTSYYQYGALFFWDSISSFDCRLTCSENGNEFDCSDSFFSVTYPGQLCEQYCNYDLPLFIVFDEGLLFTELLVALPSPIPYKLKADGRTLFIGTESALFVTCPSNNLFSTSDCSCNLYVQGSPNDPDALKCSKCDLTSISPDDIDYTFDCSNIFPYDICAIVSEDGRCINEQLGFECSYRLTSNGFYEYTCDNYCGPDSVLYFTFEQPYKGSPGPNEVYLFEPSQVTSVCQLECSGGVIRDYSCAENFASGQIVYRDICSTECGIDIVPYLEVARTASTIVYQVNALSPLQKTLADGKLVFIGDRSALILICERGGGISVANCRCDLAIEFDTLFYELSTTCIDCEIGGFDEYDRPVFGFDCSNVFKGSCAIVTPDGYCIDDVPTPMPTPSPGKGKGGKGKGGGTMMGMKTPKEPKTAKAMMASAKGKKSAYKANAASSTEYSTKESDTPKGPMSSKQVVA